MSLFLGPLCLLGPKGNYHSKEKFSVKQVAYFHEKIAVPKLLSLGWSVGMGVGTSWGLLYS